MTLLVTVTERLIKHGNLNLDVAARPLRGFSRDVEPRSYVGSLVPIGQRL